MDQQQQKHRPRTDSCLRHCSGRGGGLNAFYWYQILVPDYVVVKAQQLFGSHGKMNCFVIDIQVPVCLKKVSIYPCNIFKILYLLTCYLLYLQKMKRPRL